MDGNIYNIQKLDDKNIYRNQKALNQTIVNPYWEVPKFCDEHKYWDFFFFFGRYNMVRVHFKLMYGLVEILSRATVGWISW